MRKVLYIYISLRQLPPRLVRVLLVLVLVLVGVGVGVGVGVVVVAVVAVVVVAVAVAVVVVVKTMHMRTKDVGVASKGSLLKKAGGGVQGGGCSASPRNADQEK